MHAFGHQQIADAVGEIGGVAITICATLFQSGSVGAGAGCVEIRERSLQTRAHRVGSVSHAASSATPSTTSRAPTASFGSSPAPLPAGRQGYASRSGQMNLPSSASRRPRSTR